MFFKNIHFYKFEEDFKMTPEAMHQAMTDKQARPCGQQEPSCLGWEKPLGRGGQMLVHVANGCIMMNMLKQERLLPPAIIRKRVEDAAADLEAETGRPVGRKEKGDLKEQIVLEMLPNALIKESMTHAYIDPIAGLLVVNASGANKADDLIELLRKTFGTFNVVLPSTETSPEVGMTGWLMDAETLPAPFSIDAGCELKISGDHAGTIKCKGIDIGSDEVRAHIGLGARVSKLDMSWDDDKVSFALNEDLTIKRIRFDSALQDEAGSVDDEVSLFESDFTIMSSEIRKLIADLMKILS